MGTVIYAFCVLFAVVMFWLGMRFIVFHKYIVEIVIGVAAVLGAVHIVIFLYVLWPPL
jgi:hypothetical protein